MQADAELPVVTAAKDARAGRCSYDVFRAAFADAAVYAQRPQRPGLFVTEVPGRGRWTPVFSRLERLAAHAGECEYLMATGEDFLELVPDGVGVMLDPDDDHRFPVLPVSGPASAPR